MVVQKSVLKVYICCSKCKKELLRTVCGLQGVNKVDVDQEEGTLTVIGEADPYDIINKIRKGCKFARLESVGPPPKPEDPEPDEVDLCELERLLCSGYYACSPNLCPAGYSCSGCIVCKPVAYQPVAYQPVGYQPAGYMAVDHAGSGSPCSIM